jgi:transposase, IS5 family
VDATILAAPPSKNAEKACDPEMRQTKKGNPWHFGMKAHIGTDRGTVHSLTTTSAAVADVTQMPELMHGEESEWYGDRAYWNERDRQYARSQAIRYRIQRRTTAGKPLGKLCAKGSAIGSNDPGRRIW